MLSIRDAIFKYTFRCCSLFSLPSFHLLLSFKRLPTSFHQKIPLNWHDDKLYWLKLNIKKLLLVGCCRFFVVVVAVVFVIKKWTFWWSPINQWNNGRTNKRKKKKKKINSNPLTNNKMCRYSQSAARKINATRSEKRTKEQKNMRKKKPTTKWNFFFLRWNIAEAITDPKKSDKRNMKIYAIHTNTE